MNNRNNLIVLQERVSLGNLMEDCCCYAGLAIVEDEMELVNIMLRLFKIHKIGVCFVAHDGMEAVMNFDRCDPKPHLILMDYRLPSMNGIDATKRILKISPDTKIIFISADESIKNEALKAGAVGFLQKPASLKEISHAIEDVITKSPWIKIYSP